MPLALAMAKRVRLFLWFVNYSVRFTCWVYTRQIDSSSYFKRAGHVSEVCFSISILEGDGRSQHASIRKPSTNVRNACQYCLWSQQLSESTWVLEVGAMTLIRGIPSNSRYHCWSFPQSCAPSKFWIGSTLNDRGFLAISATKRPVDLL